MSFFKNIISSISAQTIKGYELDKESQTLGGSQLLWKVYKATKNDKSKQIGTVFYIENKTLDQMKPQIKQEALSILKKEYSSLSRLRHPSILTLQESLIEEKQYMAYVTERVECSLATALDKPTLFNEHCSSDIELKMHILELIEGLQFLHNDVKCAHLDISPNNIYITNSGKWKIAGSAYQQQIINKTEMECPQIDFSSQYKPQLSYSAPELLQTKAICSFASDVFSLAMVILRLFKQKHDKISFPQFSDQQSYLNFVNRLQYEVNSPPYTTYYEPQFMQFFSNMFKSSNQRPTLLQFQQHEWFNDPYLQVFNVFQKLQTFDQQQQIQFLKGVSDVIFELEQGFVKRRIFPQLLEFIRYDYLVSIIVQIIIEALKKKNLYNQQQFQAELWPKLKEICHSKEIPAQTLYDIVWNIELFYEYLDKEQINNSILPLQIKCFECKVGKLQDIALRTTEFVVQQNDYTFTKNKILPRILNLCSEKNQEIRKTSLICLYRILDILDRQTINEQVLQILEKGRNLQNTTEIKQVTLKIYQAIAKNLPIDIITTKLMPQLTPYLTDINISREEFDEYYQTILSLLKRIQEEKYKTTTENKEMKYVDLTLKLPDPKKDQKQNKFEFLNQFGVNKNQEVAQPYQASIEDNWFTPAGNQQLQIPQSTSSQQQGFDFFNQNQNQNQGIVESQQNKKDLNNDFFQQVQQQQQEQKKLNQRPLYNQQQNDNKQIQQPYTLPKPPGENKQNDPFAGFTFNQAQSQSQQQPVISNQQIQYKQQTQPIQQLSQANKNQQKGNMLKLDFDPFADLSSDNSNTIFDQTIPQQQTNMQQWNKQQQDKPKQQNDFDLI